MYPRDWRDERAPYYRVNYGNGQVSEVFHGKGARAGAEAHLRRMESGTAFLQTYLIGSADEPGEKWFTARK